MSYTQKYAEKYGIDESRVVRLDREPNTKNHMRYGPRNENFTDLGEGRFIISGVQYASCNPTDEVDAAVWWTRFVEHNAMDSESGTRIVHLCLSREQSA